MLQLLKDPSKKFDGQDSGADALNEATALGRILAAFLEGEEYLRAYIWSHKLDIYNRDSKVRTSVLDWRTRSNRPQTFQHRPMNPSSPYQSCWASDRNGLIWPASMIAL